MVNLIMFVSLQSPGSTSEKSSIIDLPTRNIEERRRLYVTPTIINSDDTSNT